MRCFSGSRSRCNRLASANAAAKARIEEKLPEIQSLKNDCGTAVSGRDTQQVALSNAHSCHFRRYASEGSSRERQAFKSGALPR